MGQGPKRPRGMLVAAVLILAVAVAGVWLYRSWSGADGVSAENLKRVLIVAASPDEKGDVVGQIIVVLDVSSGDLEAVSPALAVTIPGTSYSTLGDAYPFGGGAGTSDALARARGEEALPYVAIDAEALFAAVKAANGAGVELPADMSVFDGDELFTFEAGEQTLSAEELCAVLKGAPYLSEPQREKLDAELASVLAEVLAASPDALAAGQTDLSDEAMAVVEDSLVPIAR